MSLIEYCICCNTPLLHDEQLILFGETICKSCLADEEREMARQEELLKNIDDSIDLDKEASQVF
jgi:hypothetical protein